MWVKGARVRGKLIEKNGEDHWIVSIGGKLLGVENKTGIALRIEQWMELEVVSDSPMTFQLIGRVKNNPRTLHIRI